MTSWRGSSSGTSPLVTTLFLIGSAAVLTGGFYFARGIATGSGADPPEVGIWSDDGNDRLLVVLGDQKTDWHDVEVRTSAAARVRLDGQADATHGALSPGTEYVRLSAPGQGVTGGDALSLCVLGTPGKLDISLRDAVSSTIIFEQTMSVQACAAATP